MSTSVEQAFADRDYETAIELLTFYIEMRNIPPSEKIEPLLQRAYAHECLDEYVNALQDYESVLALDSKNFEAQLSSASCCIILETSLDVARERLNWAIEESPDHPRALDALEDLNRLVGELESGEVVESFVIFDDELTNVVQSEPSPSVSDFSIFGSSHINSSQEHEEHSDNKLSPQSQGEH